MTPIATTYVRHGDKCFVVNTSNRASSAPAAYGGQYAETLVWEWLDQFRARGQLIGQAEAPRDSIRKHLDIVEQLHTCGSMMEENDD